MCIRDRASSARIESLSAKFLTADLDEVNDHSCLCLLYTSDAADEGLGVDLGGRRIIKK